LKIGYPLTVVPDIWVTTEYHAIIVICIYAMQGLWLLRLFKKNVVLSICKTLDID